MEIWPKANAAERINSVHSFFTSILPEVSLLDSGHQIVIHLVSLRPYNRQLLHSDKYYVLCEHGMKRPV